MKRKGREGNRRREGTATGLLPPFLPTCQLLSSQQGQLILQDERQAILGANVIQLHSTLLPDKDNLY
jgi:hypothetical protein